MKILWCFHGFLGLASDWNFLREPLQGVGYEVRAVDLWGSFARLSPPTIRGWAHGLLEEIRRERAPAALLGYSLGGRLVAHILGEAGDEVSKGICVGAHLGLVRDEERAARRESDARWADRFRREAWSELMAAWNSQEVFQASRPMAREETSFDREILARVLEVGSLGGQEYLAPSLRHDRRLSIVVGERDEKFLKLVRGWQRTELPDAWVSLVSNAGHRVPWDEPEEFVQTLIRALEQ